MLKNSKKTRIIIIGAVNALFAGKLYEDFGIDAMDPFDRLFIKPEKKVGFGMPTLSGVWKKSCKCDWPCHCDSKFKMANIRKLPGQNYRGPSR